ncbi:MAG: hypothetical protein ABFR63_12250 [Thermodesulfobacteriota bacterium]
MPTPDSPVASPSAIGSEEIDLGLQLPAGFDLQPLFPHDRLLRLHPNWFISDFHQDGVSFTTTIKDYATEEEFPLSGTLVFNESEDEILSIALTETIEVSIRFLNRNNQLKVQVHSPQGELETNDPLLLWIRAIREYIRIYVKKTPVTLFFRLVMNRMVLEMNPSQRKICLMLVRLTLLEILVILVIVVGYVIFVL